MDLLKILKIYQIIIKYNSLIKIIKIRANNMIMMLMIKNQKMMNMEMNLLILHPCNKIYKILINLIFLFRIEFLLVENVQGIMNKKMIRKKILKKFKNLQLSMIKQIQTLSKIFKIRKKNRRKKLNLKSLEISKGLVASQVILII